MIIIIIVIVMSSPPVRFQRTENGLISKCALQLVAFGIAFEKRAFVRAEDLGATNHTFFFGGNKVQMLWQNCFLASLVFGLFVFGSTTAGPSKHHRHPDPPHPRTFCLLNGTDPRRSSAILKPIDAIDLLSPFIASMQE